MHLKWLIIHHYNIYYLHGMRDRTAVTSKLLYMNIYTNTCIWMLTCTGIYFVCFTLSNGRYIALLFSSSHQVCSKNMTMHLTCTSFLIPCIWMLTCTGMYIIQMFCLFYIVKWTMQYQSSHLFTNSALRKWLCIWRTFHFLITQQEKRKIIRMDHRSYIKKLQCFGG